MISFRPAAKTVNRADLDPPAAAYAPPQGARDDAGADEASSSNRLGPAAPLRPTPVLGSPSLPRRDRNDFPSESGGCATRRKQAAGEEFAKNGSGRDVD